ncbi:hypothetical protein DFJ74DRAFT_686244 [Hyaloraphidium curvatum]|nr:hypothetical protein DFJ74DRAFT_686244 [Hyaloraphidium curvatum]
MALLPWSITLPHSPRIGTSDPGCRHHRAAMETTMIQTYAAASWFSLFKNFGLNPSPTTYRPLFAPDGSVEDAGAAPVPAERTGEAIALVLKLIPDLKIDMRRHRVRGDTVFVDAHNMGTVRGTEVEWPAVYRVRLKNMFVHRGRRFYDQAAIFRALAPDMPTLPALPAGSEGPAPSYGTVVTGLPDDFDVSFAEDCVVEVADQATPIAPAQLPHHLAGAPFEAVDWARDERFAFVEWKRGDILGVDRLEIRDGKVTSFRRLFDTLGMVAEMDPKMLELRKQFLSNEAN